MKVFILFAVTAMLLTACSRTETIHQNTVPMDKPTYEQTAESVSQPTAPATHRFNNGMIIMPGSGTAYDTAQQLK
ncbi:MAG: hypothetical protein EOP51_30910 [Sphingobacteriales bacterium]|nr:MAG: hypothetical protein EOP51_30910 [Sphingobacteriales bacterium]